MVEKQELLTKEFKAIFGREPSKKELRLFVKFYESALLYGKKATPAQLKIATSDVVFNFYDLLSGTDCQALISCGDLNNIEEFHTFPVALEKLALLVDCEEGYKQVLITEGVIEKATDIDSFKLSVGVAYTDNEGVTTKVVKNLCQFVMGLKEKKSSTPRKRTERMTSEQKKIFRENFMEQLKQELGDDVKAKTVYEMFVTSLSSL